MITIQNDHGERIGSINFERNPNYLRVYRTAAGFTMQIPMEIRLRVPLKNEPRALLSNLRGNLIAKDPSGTFIEIGHLRDQAWYSTGWSDNPVEDSKNDTFMIWSGTLADLAFYEKIRKGGCQFSKFSFTENSAIS